MPFLFEEASPPLPPADISRVTSLSPSEKSQLITSGATPLPVLAELVQDKDINVQTLLAQRLSSLLPKMDMTDAKASAMLIGAIKQMTEESVTPVRVALSSALKDVANTPPEIARRLADDVERAVAEPIILYSLSLSDDDLLDLISRYPQEWQTVSIARRKKLSSPVGDAVVGTGNIDAGKALISNDGAAISPQSLEKLGDNPEYVDALRDRNGVARKIRRDLNQILEHSLYVFLRKDAQLDKSTTHDVLKTIHRRVEHQDNHAALNPADLSEEQLRDAVALGDTELVIKALAIRARTTDKNVRRMIIDSGAAKPVIALCVRAGLPMSFAVLLQQRMTRLPPAKILYPVNGTETPISDEEVRWQLEFFGV